MFELTWTCAVISLVLGVGTWLDAKRRPPLWRLPALAWVTLVVVTWVAVVPYAVGRVVQRRPTVSVR